MSVVIRRSPLRLAIAATATAVALSGCATFTNADVLAQSGDDDITNDDFEPLAEEYFANPDVFGTTPVDGGRADAEQSRILLSVMVRQLLINQFLDHNGVDATEVRQAFTDTALAGTPVAELSDEIQALVVDTAEQPRTEALSLVQPPSADELGEMYIDNPPSTGVTCVRHILLDTEADADEVLDELAEGADFATLAVERSIDPTAVDNGGAIADVDNECVSLQIVLQGFDPGFTAGALQGASGVPSGPYQSSIGWHVIMHRPWDEVADSVVQLHQPADSGVLLFDGFAATAEVTVDPRYGSWDAVAASILPVG